MRRLLITGAAGFVGTNLARLVLAEYPDWQVVAFDALTASGNLANLDELEQTGRFEFVGGDIGDEAAVRRVFARGIGDVINCAVERRVEQDVDGRWPLVRTNLVGTQLLLEYSRRAGVHCFVQVSTDEVYGNGVGTVTSAAEAPLAPQSLLGAVKAGADLLVRAYSQAYGLSAVITRCARNYGPYQFPGQLIPRAIASLLADRPVPLDGEGDAVHEWIHVADHCRALLCALERGRAGEVYNIGADSAHSAAEVVAALAAELERSAAPIAASAKARGSGRGRLVDLAKLRRELGWQPRVGWERGLADTVRWYCEHRRWWQAIESGEYRRYYSLRNEKASSPV